MVGAAVLIAALAVAGVVPVADANILPEAGDFRMQAIEKAGSEMEWPFVAERGMLLCVVSPLGRRYVYFMPEGRDDLGRAFNLDVNIMAMSIVNLGLSGVLLPYEDPKQLLARIVPFVTMGQRLCNQDPGTVVTGSEL